MYETAQVFPHHHDVSIIWYVWPLDVILWDPVKEFLQGHGFNIINNIMYDLFWPYLHGFNFVRLWLPFAGLFNFIFIALNFLPNLIFGTISRIIFIVPDTMMFIWNFMTKIFPFLLIIGTWISVTTIVSSW